MLLENNLKKYKETPEGFRKLVGLVGLLAIIIFTFIIFNNIFIKEIDMTAETDEIEAGADTSVIDTPAILGNVGWTEMDSNYVTIDSGVIDFDSQFDGTKDNLYYELPSALDTTFVMRWTVEWDEITQTSGGCDNTFKVGVSSQGDYSGNNDAPDQFVALHNVNGNGKNKWQLQAEGSSQGIGADEGWVGTGTKYYMELIDSGTTGTFTIHTGSYGGTQVGDTLTVTSMTGSDQDFIMLANRDTACTGAVIKGVIDDMQIDDNAITFATADYEFDFSPPDTTSQVTDQQYSVIQVGATETKLGITEDVTTSTTTTLSIQALQ